MPSLQRQIALAKLIQDATLRTCTNRINVQATEELKGSASAAQQHSNNGTVTVEEQQDGAIAITIQEKDFFKQETMQLLPQLHGLRIMSFFKVRCCFHDDQSTTRRDCRLCFADEGSALYTIAPQLTYLYISRCNIHDGCMPRIGLERCINLRHLSISRNKIKSFPECLYALKMLESLDISNNKYFNLKTMNHQDIHNVAKCLPGVTELNISYCALTEIPGDWLLQVLPQITVLDARHNLLTTLPNAIANLTRLQQLQVEHNRIIGD